MPIYDSIRGSNLDALQCGWLNSSELDERIGRIERALAPLMDEQILTYLCAYGYAIAPHGPRNLARILLQDNTLAYEGKIWFEFLPVSPRKNEGETHFDLALGDVRKRLPTRSGLEFVYQGAERSWIAAVEAKLRSDLSTRVSYDAFRNQLLRVIENAVTLCDSERRAPASVHVVLLTPQMFKDHPRTRFYGCKFQEYCPNGTVDRTAILADLERLQLPAVHDCDIEARLDRLSLHWVTYEDLISGIAEGDFKNCLTHLLNRKGCLVRM